MPAFINAIQVGFSPRKAALTLYLLGGRHATLLAKLGPGAKMGGGCLYIKRLDDVDKPTLQKLIESAVKNLGKAARSK